LRGNAEFIIDELLEKTPAYYLTYWLEVITLVNKIYELSSFFNLLVN